MNRLETRLLALVLLLVLPAGAAVASDSTRYGDELSDLATLRIGELLAHPERYVDQRVKVEGLVEDICPMKGCWIEILEQQSQQTIRFKVQDDVIVFPAEARGRQVVAEGILRKHEMSKQQAIDWLRHLAEEKGEPFDESTVTGPLDFYQIEGLGAEVMGQD